ncbi:MAG TPA: hypothetical protein VGD58_17375 [Herpetosiphonaceae bacterium]
MKKVWNRGCIPLGGGLFVLCVLYTFGSLLIGVLFPTVYTFQVPPVPQAQQSPEVDTYTDKMTVVMEEYMRLATEVDMAIFNDDSDLDAAWAAKLERLANLHTIVHDIAVPQALQHFHKRVLAGMSPCEDALPMLAGRDGSLLHGAELLEQCIKTIEELPERTDEPVV